MSGTDKIKILLVDDEELVREVLGGILEDLGYQVFTGADGEEGLELFRQQRPDMVITDMRMPRRDGLGLAMAIRQEAPDVPLTVITGHGTESMVLDALRAGVTDFVHKPVRMEDLHAALSRMEAARRLPAHPSLAPRLPPSVEVVDLNWTFRLDNDLTQVGPFVETLVERCGLESKAAAELSLALRELIINAVEHGNLGITFEEKTHALETGTMEQVLASRAADPSLAARRVTVQVALRDRQMVIWIRDEGQGFDPAALPDPLDPNHQFAPNGRGLLLARLSVDSMSFSAGGNVVTVVKRV